ncbi:MAG: multiprotein-bridging factor 1 family protein [Rhizobiaceae bacterium]
MNIFEETPDGDTIGGRLSRARHVTGLSPTDFAWRLGVKVATVKAWESDRSMPSSHRLATIGGILNVSLSWLLHGVGTAPSDDYDAPVYDPEINGRLERLVALHAETGALIQKLQSDLGRAASR